MRLRIIVGMLLVGVSIQVAASGQQEPLTNDAVIKLVKAGMSQEVVISIVQQQPARYSVSTDDLINLKSAGVPDKVVAAMVAKAAGGPSSSSNNLVGDTGGPFQQPGVYYKKGDQWVEMLPEVVNWKTGGVLKNFGSLGIVKKDINGHLPNPNSRNSVKTPLDFTIYVFENTAITEYQLIRLRVSKDYREFRTVTGGVLNTKSGATRDVVPFEGKKVGNRLYSVILPSTLGAGEYGFIYLGASGGAGGMTSLSMGKMYTFRLLE